MSIKTRLKSYLKSFNNKVLKACLKNNDFTIISNNCWGGEVYKELNLPYKSPFIGLFLFAPCYIKLIKNLKEYTKKDMDFVTVSKYSIANEYRDKRIWNFYPIGLINNEIEIHFMHYQNEIDAREKWLRRIQRINWDSEKLFFKFCDRGLCTKELIEEFDKLDYLHKICFTSKNYSEFSSTLWIKECQQEDCVVDGGTLYQIGKKYFDVVDWLNGGSGQIQNIQKIVNNWLYIN